MISIKNIHIEVRLIFYLEHNQTVDQYLNYLTLLIKNNKNLRIFFNKKLKDCLSTQNTY